ncbi:hypothetical protein TNCV_3276961 [Trichonephila clavipes]|nr:hypothetical protein TNCV_3276961 [Trichonephila clavipes]
MDACKMFRACVAWNHSERMALRASPSRKSQKVCDKRGVGELQNPRRVFNLKSGGGENRAKNVLTCIELKATVKVTDAFYFSCGDEFRRPRFDTVHRLH